MNFRMSSGLPAVAKCCIMPTEFSNQASLSQVLHTASKSSKLKMANDTLDTIASSSVVRDVSCTSLCFHYQNIGMYSSLTFTLKLMFGGLRQFIRWAEVPMPYGLFCLSAQRKDLLFL